jgi:hypothetical protein
MEIFNFTIFFFLLLMACNLTSYECIWLKVTKIEGPLIWNECQISLKANGREHQINLYSRFSFVFYSFICLSWVQYHSSINKFEFHFIHIYGEVTIWWRQKYLIASCPGQPYEGLIFCWNSFLTSESLVTAIQINN